MEGAGAAGDDGIISTFVDVTVTVVEARGLVKKDKFGKSDPFVELHTSCDPEVRSKTAVVWKSLQPKWDHEVHRFRYCDSGLASDDSPPTLIATVFDKDRLSADDFMGRVEVLLEPGHLDEWFDLVAVEAGQRVSGAVRLMVRVEVHAQTVQLSRGASLRELPDSPEKTGETVDLLVTVVSGHRLNPRQSFHLGFDPYVTIEIGGLQAKTKIKGATSNPVWNETFRFVVRKPLTNSKLHCTVFDKDYFSARGFVGMFTIPGSAFPTQLHKEVSHEYLIESADLKKMRGKVRLKLKVVEHSSSKTSLDRGLEMPAPELQINDADVAPSGTVLSMSIVEAKGLVPDSSSGKIHPYVMVTLGGKYELRTNYITSAQAVVLERRGERKMSNPAWKARLEFIVENFNARFKFEVKNSHAFYKGDGDLGACTHTLGSLLTTPNQTVERWLTLRAPSWMSEDQVATYDAKLRVVMTLSVPTALVPVHRRSIWDSTGVLQRFASTVEREESHAENSPYQTNFSLGSTFAPALIKDAAHASVGSLKVSIVRAADLQSLKWDRPPDVYVEMMLGSSCQRTSVKHEMRSPNWGDGETHTFEVTDLSDCIDVCVFSQGKSLFKGRALDKPTFLGALRIRLDNIVTRELNSRLCWYRLKDNQLLPSTDKLGKLLMKLELRFNAWAAAAALKKQAAVQLCDCEPTQPHRRSCTDRKFTIGNLKLNVNRVKALIKKLQYLSDGLKSLRCWEDPKKTAVVASIYLYTVWDFHQWMPPLYALLLLLYIRHVKTSRTLAELDDAVEIDVDDAKDSSDPALEDADDDGGSKTNTRLKLGMFEELRIRLQMYPRIVQNTLGVAVGFLERIENMLNWSHPFNTTVLCVLLGLVMLVLLVIPLRYILLAHGVFWWTKKLWKKTSSTPPPLKFLSHFGTSMDLKYQDFHVSFVEESSLLSKARSPSPRLGERDSEGEGDIGRASPEAPPSFATPASSASLLVQRRPGAKIKRAKGRQTTSF